MTLVADSKETEGLNDPDDIDTDDDRRSGAASADKSPKPG